MSLKNVLHAAKSSHASQPQQPQSDKTNEVQTIVADEGSTPADASQVVSTAQYGATLSASAYEEGFYSSGSNGSSPQNNPD